MKKYPLSLLFVGSYTAVIVATLILVFGSASEKAREDSRLELNRIASKISVSLDKYRSIPTLLSGNERVVNLFEAPDTKTRALSNRLLEQYNDELGSDVIFLIDKDGETIAASNWNLSDSFVGTNYAFRPYFANAINGDASSYFALGTRSGKRGYYFSYPVNSAGQTVGVVALKVSISMLEEYVLPENMDFLLTDKDGIVLFSSVKEWNYRSLAMLDQSVKSKIEKERRFGSVDIQPLLKDLSLKSIGTKEGIDLPFEGEYKHYLKEEALLPSENWRLRILTPVADIYGTAALSAAYATGAYLLVLFVGLYWRGRIQNQKELSQLNDQLEARVEDRTRKWKDANAKLTGSVERYKRSEKALEQTQNELIQAAKLATLGEMSAGINHELNQPLTALRTYAENAKKLILKNEISKVDGNLDEMLRLSSMMATIVNQLKVFARKSSGKVVPIRLKDVVEESIAILQNKIRKHDVQLEIQSLDESVLVYAESIQLEQVLINLLSNAIEAANGTDRPSLRLTFGLSDDLVLILLEDNGEGFHGDQQSALFEPFYTTKQKGLGLGLALSKRIIEAFDGRISAKNREAGGAAFEVVLRRG